MLVITAVKFLVIGFSAITLGCAAIGTGILFAGYILGASKNPEEADNLFGSALMAFALIETFVFMSLIISALVYVL